MTDYAFSSKFSAAPLGPFTSTYKRLAWPDQALNDQDPNGHFFTLVDDSRLGGRCCRMRYPAGDYGMGSKFYQLRITSPRTVANLEFDFLFEEGFDLNPPNPENLGGGKIGPCINWGEVGGVTEKRGTRAMMWYNANGSNNAHPVFSPSCQDQRSGDQYIQPVVYTKPIVLEQVYHWKIQIFGGEEGWAKYWLNNDLLATSIPGQHLQVTPEDDVLFDFAFFAGGGATNACRWDSFARHGNVKCWSGEGAYGAGTPEEPPQVEDITYEVVGGTLTLRPMPKSALPSGQGQGKQQRRRK
jgi:hypothetical protein